ncbi:SDR family oxidoreductase [Phenylobacterium sp. Root700]|uniref:SDR family oxidoreductase n=1 Tax=Phenylobacterium sp. Root700 TaxID=1736591 RepID=UPI0006F851E7|nr:SDR family oxidoreductase [Phenylobacterium sp. Root700]KRB40687.1 NAD(P)-dependent oxidoreductase [Phenylobacterium sp. Root700]
MYAITGASGHLGRLALNALLETIAPAQVVALARDPAKLADLAARGVQVRRFDYEAPQTLAPALAGVERLLLISSSEVGKRGRQHQAVIDAAKTAGVGFIAYTSILHADTNPMGLAAEHRATEAALRESGLAHALLRNGWYTENYVQSAPAALAHGALLGSAGEGEISGASRADYAAAAAKVLTGEAATKVYELAGDEAFTLAQFAQALSDIAGKPVVYTDLPEADYAAALKGAGLPAPVADMLAESDAKAAKGSLFDDSRVLSGLIGRPTTPFKETLATGVKG